MKRYQLSNILCTLILAAWSHTAVADDFSQFIPGYKKSTPTRKIPKPAAPVKAKKAPFVSDRQQCNKDLDTTSAPDILPIADQCANSLEEVKQLFPDLHKAISQLAGTWSDFHVNDYADQVYELQQKTGKYENNVPLPIVQNQMNFKASSEGFVLQYQDFDEKAKIARTEPLKVQFCSGANGYFFRSDSNQFPIKFKSNKCIWIGNNGKWTAQRKLEFSKDFEKSVQRAGVQ